ncbi:hypothetical protein KSP39_PZI002032 [Platanthera zijinensis]|uniref:Uncharacterized protein n=1 Tax=Platanthera zijinensis TaxID=2320716 RepID=A0AAP0BYX9_9ASPA
MTRFRVGSKSNRKFHDSAAPHTLPAQFSALRRAVLSLAPIFLYIYLSKFLSIFLIDLPHLLARELHPDRFSSPVISFRLLLVAGLLDILFAGFQRFHMSVGPIQSFSPARTLQQELYLMVSLHSVFRSLNTMEALSWQWWGRTALLLPVIDVLVFSFRPLPPISVGSIGYTIRSILAFPASQLMPKPCKPNSSPLVSISSFALFTDF